MIRITKQTIIDGLRQIDLIERAQHLGLELEAGYPVSCYSYYHPQTVGVIRHDLVVFPNVCGLPDEEKMQKIMEWARGIPDLELLDWQ